MDIMQFCQEESLTMSGKKAAGMTSDFFLVSSLSFLVGSWKGVSETFLPSLSPLSFCHRFFLSLPRISASSPIYLAGSLQEESQWKSQQEFAS